MSSGYKKTVTRGKGGTRSRWVPDDTFKSKDNLEAALRKIIPGAWLDLDDETGTKLIVRTDLMVDQETGEVLTEDKWREKYC